MKRLYLILWITLILTQTVICDGQIMVMDSIEYDGPGHVPDEIIVKFKPGVGRSEIAKINSQHGTSEIYTSPFAGYKRFKIPKARTAEQMVDILSKNPNVEYTELNYIAYAFMIPNDPIYSFQWHLDNLVYGGIGMEEAWELSSGAGVTVAVIDTGVADPPSGDDLQDTRIVDGYDFVNNDNDPTDDNGHGTHVAGTIAQSTDNGIGVAGVAYSCLIMPVKVLNRQGSGTYADIADGIYYAANNGAEVINMSLGGSFPSTTLENALAHAYSEGVTIVCAAGNNGSYQVSYPARYNDYCIAVGATRYDEAVAYYSNRGPDLDLTAPGGDITVDQNGDGYGDGVLQQTFQRRSWGYYFFQGTSMAAPHVAGVAALLISNDVATTPDQVREALESTAEDKGAGGWDSEYGWGIVDAYAALQWNSESVDYPPTVSITSPADGATVSGMVTVSADASDDNGVNQVEFFVDGSSIGLGTYDSLSDTWSKSWNTTAYSDGSHEVSATATDTAGKTGSDAIDVTVDNIDSPPIVAIVYPGDGSTVSGVIDVFADAVDDKGITQVEFFVDGSSIGLGTYDSLSDTWSKSWNTNAYSDGSHRVLAMATDTTSQTDSEYVDVTVDNSTPSTTMHVGDLDGIADIKGKSGNWEVFVTVTVHDENHQTVSNAIVEGIWSGGISETIWGMTGSNGTVTFTTGTMKSGTYVTFKVDNVTHQSLTYELLDNHDEESDSNGTSITVTK